MIIITLQNGRLRAIYKYNVLAAIFKTSKMKQLLFILTSLFLFGQILFGQNKFKKEKVAWVAFDWADPNYKDVMLILQSLTL